MRGHAVTVLKRGSYFGEVGLLRSARRSACVKAISDTCDLFVLSKVGVDWPLCSAEQQQPAARSSVGMIGRGLQLALSFTHKTKA